MFSRLNCGRFNEDSGDQNSSRSLLQTDNNNNNNHETKSNATSVGLKTTVVGSSQARFLGEYNPMLNKPIERRNMNSDVVLLPELTKALDELRHSKEYTVHHKQKDSVKGYMDEVAKFSAATKFRK